jgi:hypothetical protein
MQPVTLLVVFVMVVAIQALVWGPFIYSDSEKEFSGFPLEETFQAFYNLGTLDFAKGDATNIDLKSFQVNTDKLAYMNGDEIKIFGMVSPMVNGDVVTLSVLDKQDHIVSLEFIKPNSDGKFSKTFSTSDLQNEPGKYTVSLHYDLKQTTTQFEIEEKSEEIIPLEPVFEEKTEIHNGPTNEISLMTSKAVYNVGDTIQVSGQILTDSSDSFATMLVLDPENVTIAKKDIVLSSTNEFSAELIASGSFWQQTGIYTIQVLFDSGQTVAKTYFVFDSTGQNTVSSSQN